MFGIKKEKDGGGGGSKEQKVMRGVKGLKRFG